MNTNSAWFKSSHSQSNGDCIEVRQVGGVRDSKDKSGPVLDVSPEQITLFARAAAAGLFGELPTL